MVPFAQKKKDIKGRQAISTKQHFAPHYSPNKCNLLGLLYYIPHFFPFDIINYTNPAWANLFIKKI